VCVYYIIFGIDMRMMKHNLQTLFKANGTCEITTPSYLLEKSLTSMQFAQETHSTFSSFLCARIFSRNAKAESQLISHSTGVE
jgi:hypothetical protein